MPPPVRTHQLLSVNLMVGGSIEVVEIVPPGERWLVKGYSVWNNDAATRTVFCGRSVAGLPQDVLYARVGMPAETLAQSLVQYVLEPGDELYLYADAIAGGGVMFHLGGVVFELP